MTARTNETGRRAARARRRVAGTVATAVLILCVPAVAPAKNGEQLPPGQAKKLGQAPAGQAVTAAPGQLKKAARKAPRGQAKKAVRSAPRGQAKKAVQQASPGQLTKAARQALPAQATSPAAQASRLAARPVPPGQAKKAAGSAAAAPGQVRKASGAAPRGQARRAARAATRARAARASAAAQRRAATQRRLGARRARASAVNLPAALAAPALAATQTRTAAQTGTATTAPGAANAAPANRTTPGQSHRVATTSKPRSRQQSARGPVRTVTHTVTRTVRDIAHVIPGWAKALMAALGLLLAVAAALILAAAYRNRRLRAQRAALLADVGALQAALLPVVPERAGALRVSVAYRPAEGLAAGGDFYDVFPLSDGRVGLLVGDVSGHGRESLPAATFTRHMVRAYLEAGLAPREALQVAGRVVDQQKRDDEFATLIAAVHDPTAGTLSYASAGHPPPIVLGPAAHEPMIVGSSPPLGVDSATGLRQTTLPLPAGSTVCLFTDGLFEARRGTAILGRKRVAAMLEELGTDATARDLVDRVERESDAIHDDVAVCLIHVDGDTSVAGTVRVEELEVQPGEIDGSRVRRFLEGAGVDAAEMGSVMAAARKRAATDGSVLLRVRLARDRSGVDVLPARADGAAAPVAALSARRAAER